MRAALKVVWVVGFGVVGCAASGGGDTRDRDGGGGVRDSGVGDTGVVDAAPTPDTSVARPDVGPGADGGPTPGFCAPGAELVYLIDRNQRLVRFDPRDLSFTDVGAIGCASSGTRPFSMSVDHDARAWVLFSDYQIRRVSTTDGRCEGDTVSLAAPFEQYGMGFTATGTDEVLYVSGGTFIDLLEGSPSRPAQLGRYVPGTGATSTIGPLANWPELSGNADGELFAFYPPGPFDAPARVVEVDPATATERRAFELTDMVGDFDRSYAFAYWGGRLWVFIKPSAQTGSEVWRFDLPPEGDGSITKVVDDARITVVGAGVSICAPVDLI